MAKPKAAPIRDGVHIDESAQRIVKLLRENPDTAEKLKLSEGTAVADILVEHCEHHKASRNQKSEAAKKRVTIKSKPVQERDKTIARHAKELLAGGKEKHQLVGIMSGLKIESANGEICCPGPTQLRKILKEANILEPKKKTRTQRR